MRIDEIENTNSREKLLHLFSEFLKLCQEELVLDKLPTIKWIANGGLDKEHNSFGSFHNGNQVIQVEITNRHPLDIMRTLAHELVHYRQYLDGEIGEHSGEDGSPQENEAHAVAGIIMRKFDREHPETFRFKPIGERSN